MVTTGSASFFSFQQYTAETEHKGLQNKFPYQEQGQILQLSEAEEIKTKHKKSVWLDIKQPWSQKHITYQLLSLIHLAGGPQLPSPAHLLVKQAETSPLRLMYSMC